MFDATTKMFKLLLSLVLIGAGSYAEDLVNDIPEQCKTLSVTPVSCAALEPTSDGLQPHPDACQLFYYCPPGHAAPICRQCPAGLHFSPDTHVCDQPTHAGCQ